MAKSKSIRNKVLSNKSGFVMDKTNMKPKSFGAIIKNTKQYSRVKH